MYFLLNLSHYVKSCGHFCQILALFIMPAHQIWSSHVTQEANFDKFLFCSNSAFNIKKSHKISGRKSLYFRSYQPKTSRGMENTFFLQLRYFLLDVFQEVRVGLIKSKLPYMASTCCCDLLSQLN